MYELIKKILDSDVGSYVTVILLGGISWGIISVVDPKGTDWRIAIEFAVIMGFFLGVGSLISFSVGNAEKRRKNEEEEREEERRRQMDKAVARANLLGRVSDIVSRAQLAAAELPLMLSAADSSLDLAQDEYAEGLYSPFWEAMEEAIHYVHAFEKNIQQIKHAQEDYQREQQDAQHKHGGGEHSLARGMVPFSLGVKIFPDIDPTKERMKRLYRQAQKKADFANIYEQRRNTQVLIAGFRSLGDAVTSLGDRIEREVRALGDTLGFRLGDLGMAVREASEQMQRQQETLLTEARSWRAEASTGHAELVRVARENAERAERGARERRDMLDNIQRGRKPSILGF